MFLGDLWIKNVWEIYEEQESLGDLWRTRIRKPKEGTFIENMILTHRIVLLFLVVVTRDI